MGQVTKKLETAANIAVILAAAVFIVVAVRHYLGGKPNSARTIEVGEHLGLSNVNWASNNKNIVLALSTGCHFCTESAGFYRELTRQSKLWNVRTIAVLPQDADAAGSYLKNLNISVDEVRQANLPDIGIHGTPTVLWVTDQGVVQSVWNGKLPDNGEKEILAKIAH